MTAALPPELHPVLLDEVRGYRGHALLLTGPARAGKGGLALRIAALQNCSGADPRSPEAPCGHCASCRSLALGAHPDLLTVSPRTTTSTGRVARRRIIPIGAILEERDDAHEFEQHVYQFVELRPTYRRRVVLIEGAEHLNENAANALLKLIEEPPYDALFLLLAEDLRAVMPTIVSRSARLSVTPLGESGMQRAATLAGLQPDPELLALAAGRPGVLGAAEAVTAALEDGRRLTEAVRGSLLETLEAAETMEKRFDSEWHVQALHHLWQHESPQVRAHADDALERLLSALEGYASPSLAFQVFALDLRAAFGEGG
ncbi:DNA polymerase III [Deinococcus sonorensis]|uniref:DNA polymerase III n=2 Tax=Deinococcus sonorensis TaxID=309891 RepID=A0AAU7UE05_9DEIO